MMSVLALAFVNFFFTQESLKEIDSGVSIVDVASKRLTVALRTWQWVLVIYSRLAGLRPLSSVAAQISTNIVSGSASMQQINNHLRVVTNTVSSNEILSEILSTQITLYDPLTHDILNNGHLDSFTSNDILSLSNLVIGSFTGSDSDLIQLNEPLMVINNTANDYLISSEDQVSLILGGLQAIIKKNIRLLETVLIFENLALFALCLSLIVVARVVVASYSRAFQGLVRISNESAEERLYKIRKFQSILQENIEGKSFVKNLNLYLAFFESNKKTFVK